MLFQIGMFAMTIYLSKYLVKEIKNSYKEWGK